MTKKVGYGNPPDYTKFQKGQSGNPSGRRKGQKNLATVIRDELARKVPGSDGKRVSMVELIARQLVTKVAKGDLRWLPNLIRFAQLETPADSDVPDGADGKQMMADFLAAFELDEGRSDG